MNFTSPRFDTYINSHATFLDRPYVKTALALLIASYGGLILSSSSSSLSQIKFDDSLTRFSLLIVILYMGTRQPGLAVVLAVTVILIFIHHDRVKRQSQVKLIQQKVMGEMQTVM